MSDAASTRYGRVFVTGASGCIGRALVERYRAEGAEVRGVDTMGDPAADVVAGDIGDPTSWAQHAAGSDLVVHTAALVTNNVDRDRAWCVNVVGTRRVLETAVSAGAERFVHVSTMGVARFAQTGSAGAPCGVDGDLDERWPVVPTGNPYTDTKLAAEHVVLAAHASGELACTVVRPADVYGPRCRPWVLEPIVAIRNGTFLLPARGRGLFTAVYLDDLVDALVAAGERDEAAGQIFHVGGEDPVTTAEYFAHLYRMLGRDDGPRTAPTALAIALAEAVRVGARLRGRHREIGRGAMEMLAKTRPVSNAKAHAILGWRPRVDLAEGMRRTETWLRAEGLL